MVFILKKPLNDSKGIIVFRSSEHQFFQSDAQAMKEAVKALTSQYVLGTNWTWYHENVQDIAPLKFHIAGKTTISLVEGAKTFWIPYGDRNFLPNFFRPNPALKPHWDIICVANSIKAKKLDEFLKALRLVYDKRPQTRVLMICPEASDEEMRKKKKYWYSNLPKDFEQLFSAEEQQRIDLIRLKRFNKLYPITPETMAYFYQSSRVFTLFTDREGNSRVISEALLTGLPVVVKKHLQGGGLDYVNETNARLFTTVEEAAEHFLELLDHPIPLFNHDAIAQELCEDYTVPKLEQAFRTLFKELGEPFEGSWDQTNLFMKLPGHANLLPLDMVNPVAKVDDLGYQSNFLKFTDYACGTNLFLKYRHAVVQQDFLTWVKMQLDQSALGRNVKRVFFPRRVMKNP